MKKELEQSIEDFQIEDSLGAVINRAAIVVKKRLYSMLQKAGYSVTPEEFALIARLWEMDGISQTELVEKTLKDKTRVTRLLAGLIDKGYIIKRQDESDRRNYIVCLTEEGKAMKLKVVPIVQQLMKQAAAGIDERDIDTAKSVLKKVFNNINSLC